MGGMRMGFTLLFSVFSILRFENSILYWANLDKIRYTIIYETFFLLFHILRNYLNRHQDAKNWQKHVQIFIEINY